MNARVIVIALDETGAPKQETGARVSLDVMDLNIGDSNRNEMIQKFGAVVTDALFSVEEATSGL